MRVLAAVGFIFLALAWAVPAKADVQTYCEAYARNQADAHLSGSAVFGSEPELAAEEREKRKTLAFTDCLALYAPKPAVEAAPEEALTVTAEPIAVPRSKPESIIPAEQETPVAAPRSKPKTSVDAEEATPVASTAEIAAVTATAPEPERKKPAPAAKISRRAKSADHRAYCAAKHASYNPATDTYTSFSGRQRPCLVTKSQPARATTSPLPARRTKSQVSARPAKSELPARAAKSEPAATGEKSPWDSFDNFELKVGR